MVIYCIMVSVGLTETSRRKTSNKQLVDNLQNAKFDYQYKKDSNIVTYYHHS